MANPFSIDIGNPLQGLGQIAQAWGQKSQREDQAAAQAEAKAAKQQEIKDVFASNDINKMSQYMAANPQVAKGIQGAFSFKNEQTEQNMFDGAARIIGGEDPYPVIRERAEFIKSQGGDPSKTLASLNKTPEELMQSAKVMAASIDPERAKAIGLAAGKPKEFKQGTGSMSGYSFDPDTGAFHINPEVKQALNTKAAEKVASGKVLGVKDRQSINKDVTNLIKESTGIYKTAKDLQVLGALGGGPASIAMVYKFMKALDPQSVVKSDEFATAENSGGVDPYIRNVYNKLKNGEKLGKGQIAQFITTANALSDAAVDASSNEVSGYLDAYEDTLPSSFRGKLSSRISPRFGKREESVAGENQDDGQATTPKVTKWGDM